jgi:hypothetical protein
MQPFAAHESLAGGPIGFASDVARCSKCLACITKREERRKERGRERGEEKNIYVFFIVRKT